MFLGKKIRGYLTMVALGALFIMPFNPKLGFLIAAPCIGIAQLDLILERKQP